MSENILMSSKAYPKFISVIVDSIEKSNNSSEQHKLILDFAELFSSYLVGIALGEYKNLDESNEKIETQFYLHQKTKMSFGIYVSYLRALTKNTTIALIKEQFIKNNNIESAATLRVNFHLLKEVCNEGLQENFLDEVNSRIKGKNPSKTSMIETFDLLTQIRNRYAHAADYNWPLGETYYKWINPMLITTVHELLRAFESLRPLKLVKIQEINFAKNTLTFKNLESTEEDVVEIEIPKEWSSRLVENHHYQLDEKNNFLMKHYYSQIPLPHRDIVEKLQTADKLKLVEPILLPAIEEALEDDSMIDHEEYTSLLDISKNAGITEETLRELIYKVAKERGIEGDPLLMEKAVVLNLVEKFNKGEKYYTSPDYNETKTRTEFIDKVFEALGWDVTNRKGMREVELEQTVQGKVGRSTRVDYAFLLGNKEKFFVEAKAPHVNLSTDIKPAIQLRTYSWNKGLALGIVTNFKELAIYDCREQPQATDNIKTGLVLFCNYKDLPKNWEKIVELVSREAVLKGSLDTFADKKSKTLQTVDKAFLADMEKWRQLFAKDFIANNPDLLDDLGLLNYAVQMTIDRLVFLRIAEDRGAEPEEQLLKLSKAENIYERLLYLYHQADDKYNSGFFHFKDDGSETIIDEFTVALKISNECLQEVIESLYSRPYDFSALPPEILGQAYEQFLGKIITVQDGKVTIEEKPEVKKAGGVFYTPAYIVDYIVQNTLGKLLEGKNPDFVAELSVLDPSCGSGSFLIRAYQYLLDWHLNWYKENNPEKHSKDTKTKPARIFLGRDGDNDWQLTLDEKKRILTNNIYGVDIDDKAVEVTKLSLQLKVMEGNLSEDPQLRLFYDRILPNLDSNIKCGNALVGSNIYDNEEFMAFSRQEKRKINAFDWEDEFSSVFKKGGFDIVIGNPPYFNVETLGAKSPIINYIMNKSSIWMDKSDILFYFVEKAIELAKHKISFIVSNAFLKSAKAVKLRNYILDHAPISKIIDFEQFMVFDSASITSSIFELDKYKTNYTAKAFVFKEKKYTQAYVYESICNVENFFNVDLLKDHVFALVKKNIAIINNKIDGNHIKLGNLFKVGSGMQTAANDVFGFKNYPNQFPGDFIRKRMSGEIIKRYDIQKEKEYILYIERAEKFEDLPMSIQNHLNENKDFLENRATVRNEGRIWWRYSRPVHKEYYHLDKIWCSYRAKENIFCFDDTSEYIGYTNTTVIFDTNENIDLKYVLALLNSKLLNFRYRSIGKQTGSGVYEYFENGVSKLPIPDISIDLQQPFIDMANQMMMIINEKNTTKNPRDLKNIDREIKSLERKIDNMVYDLYDLTSEEIQIIEENVANN